MNEPTSGAVHENKSYGSVVVSDNATAHLGNLYKYRDSIHIAHASIHFHGHSSDQGVSLGLLRKRSHGETDLGKLSDYEADQRCLKKHKPEISNKGDSTVRSSGVVQASPSECARFERLLNHDCGLKLSLIEGITSAHVRRPASGIRLQDEGSIGVKKCGLPDRLTAPSGSRRARMVATPDATVREHSRKLLQGFALTANFVLSACRSLIQKGILHNVLRALDKTTAEVAANMIATLHSRIPLNEQLLRVPHEFVTFEDVYQRRRPLSWAILEFPEVLQGFFTAHYLGSSAQDFVSRGQFNLMIGHALVSMRDACRSRQQYGPETTLRMAVLFRASTRICLVCYNSLNYKGIGTYFWYVILAQPLQSIIANISQYMVSEGISQPLCAERQNMSTESLGFCSTSMANIDS